jgi:hypothetical protein
MCAGCALNRRLCGHTSSLVAAEPPLALADPGAAEGVTLSAMCTAALASSVGPSGSSHQGAAAAARPAQQL